MKNKKVFKIYDKDKIEIIIDALEMYQNALFMGQEFEIAYKLYNDLVKFRDRNKN